MPSERDWQDTVMDLLCANTMDLRELALIAGADPAVFYQDARLKGADLRGQDLRGMSLPPIDPADVTFDDQTRFDESVIVHAPAGAPLPPLDAHDREETGDYVMRIGSQTTAIWSRSRGLILEEPSVVALRRAGSGEPVVQAVGSEAYAMLGRTPAHMEVVRPIQEEAVVDEHVARVMFRHFLRQAAPARRAPRPRVLLCVSSSLSPTQKRVLAHALVRSGAPSVRFVEQTLASAVGMSLPIEGGRGQLVVDVGDAVTCLSVIAGSTIVYGRWVPVGLEAFESALVHHALRRHNLSLGPVTGRNLLSQIGADGFTGTSPDALIDLRGRDILHGTLRTNYVKRAELVEAIVPVLNQIAEAVAVAVHAIPQEMAAQIAADGIAVSGTAAEFRGLADKLGELSGHAIRLPADPGAAALRGGVRITASAALAKAAQVHSSP